MVLILAGGAPVSADQLTMKEGANISLSATAGPNSTLTISSIDTNTDVKVKVSDTDTADFLGAQIVSGTGINVDSSDGNNVVISATGAGILSNKGDLLTHDGVNETSLGVGQKGQALTSDSSGGLEWASGDQLFNSNALLNAYRTADNVPTVSPLKMIDGIVDAFNLGTGINGAASSNAQGDFTNHFYAPTGGSAGVPIPMVNFDGTDDYLTIIDGTLGSTEGDAFTWSFWIDFNSDGDGVLQDITANGDNNLLIRRAADNKWDIFLQDDASATQALVAESTNTFTSSDGLMHVMLAFDGVTPAVQFYINDTVETLVPSKGPTAADLDITTGTLTIGRNTNNAANYLHADIGQFYMAEEYIDISVEANRRKFIDASGNPVDLTDPNESSGFKGTLPTGNRPIIYLNKATTLWQENLGSGGNFTVNGGGLSDGTPPSIPTSGTGTDNMTLVSNSQTAKTQPNAANILLLAEDVDAITPNTDLKAFVSRDGNDPVAQVTLSEVGDFEKGKLYTGTVDLSSQPAGTSMKWKVETDNNKELNLHGVGLEWR